jgi:UDP-N-acetylglucosamine--N-acetylmuramyl-(pentapeptide) pyrophosphoryl-undecaprenol N-acetylglucosamine transferase
MPERRILFAGGGTGGSVTPLLAVTEYLQKQRPDIKVSFVGSSHGPELELVRDQGIAFDTLPTAKYRRYASLKNITDIFQFIHACFAAWSLLRELKPDVIVSAGSYVAVPVVWVGWVLNIPSLIHQQDVEAGFANRLMAWASRRITVTFERSLRDFPGKKTVVTGNPFRTGLGEGTRESACKRFGLDPALPTLLVLGGGTGAQHLNERFLETLFRFIDEVNIIHVTGRGKATARFENPHYHASEFLTDGLPDAYAAADLVISRAGLGTLTELAAFGKPTILVPLPHTHQVRNAELYAAAGAAIIIQEEKITPDTFPQLVLELLHNDERRKSLSSAIRNFARPDATSRLTQEILSLLPHDQRAK